MSNGMSHEEAHDALDALTLDALDAFERDAVLSHVAGCAICQADLASLQQTVGELAYAVTPVPMSAAQRGRVRARLLARAAADRGVPEATIPRERDLLPIDGARPPQQRGGLARSGWLALAASLIAVASVGALVRTLAERDALRVALGTAAAESGARAAALDSARAAVADRDRLIANLTGPQVAVVTLAASAGQAPSAHMFWDQSVDAWTFVAHHLPAPKPGRTYQLWLVTPTSKISAGTFAPGTNGDAVVRAKYALPKNALAAVAVTDEPDSGSAQPTTAPFMVGTKAGN